MVAALRLIRSEDPPDYDGQAQPAKRESFAMMPNAVFDLLMGDGDAIAVYMAIAKHANKSGECWPSVATLCGLTGYSDKHVRSKINRLVELGILAKEPRSTGGMKSVNVYRLSSNETEVETGMEYRTCGTENRTDRYGVPDRAVPGTDRTRSSELDPIELEERPKKSKAKPLPENGVAQQIVKAYCLVARLEAPANYGKAVGQAAMLAKAGVTPEEIPQLYEYVAGWAKGADLGLMLNQVDRWRTAKRTAPAARGEVDWKDPVAVEAYRRQAEQAMLRSL